MYNISKTGKSQTIFQLALMRNLTGEYLAKNKELLIIELSETGEGRKLRIN